jgi:hypothetical protein
MPPVIYISAGFLAIYITRNVPVENTEISRGWESEACYKIVVPTKLYDNSKNGGQACISNTHRALCLPPFCYG